MTNMYTAPRNVPAIDMGSPALGQIIRIWIARDDDSPKRRVLWGVGVTKDGKPCKVTFAKDHGYSQELYIGDAEAFRTSLIRLAKRHGAYGKGLKIFNRGVVLHMPQVEKLEDVQQEPILLAYEA
jgi:hypothetical protein